MVKTMNTWLLIIFISGNHVAKTNTIQLEFDTLELCNQNGISLVEDLSVIRNPDSGWNRSVLRSAKYKCFKVIR